MYRSISCISSLFHGETGFQNYCGGDGETKTQTVWEIPYVSINLSWWTYYVLQIMVLSLMKSWGQFLWKIIWFISKAEVTQQGKKKYDKPRSSNMTNWNGFDRFEFDSGSYRSEMSWAKIGQNLWILSWLWRIGQFDMTYIYIYVYWAYSFNIPLNTNKRIKKWKKKKF